MSDGVKISVITSVFNNKETIGDAIRSVRAQSYKNIEYLVIDGASTDGTIEVIKSFQAQIDVMQSEPDDGIYDGLNQGVRLANGDVVGFMHSDDLFANSEVLGRIAKIFSDPAVDAVYGDLVYTKKDAAETVVRYWRSGEFSASGLLKGWMPPHPTLYVRKAVYDRLGLFDTSYRIAADYDFILRLLTTKGIQIRYIPEVLVCMRLGGASNRSLKNLLQKSLEDYRALKRNGVGGLGTLVFKNLSKLIQFYRPASGVSK